MLVLAAAPWTAAAAPAARGAPAELEMPGAWLPTGPIHDPRVEYAATALADGRVLVCGGRVAFGASAPVAGCEIWSPDTEHWTPAGTLAFPRSRPAAVPLADGRVAFVGGFNYSAEPAVHDARYAIDVWDQRRNDTVTAGLLPFPAEHPHAVRLRNGRLFVVDDGSSPGKIRATTWDPTSGKSSLADAPDDAGQTVALLIDASGTLTLILARTGCRQTAIWRRPEGQPWVLAHVDASMRCAVGGFAFDDHQIVYWTPGTSPCATLWTTSSGESRSMQVPEPEHLLHLVQLEGGRLLAVGDLRSHLYVPGRGWRFAGSPGGADSQSSFTSLPDGRVLMLSQVEMRLWTKSDLSIAHPCGALTAELESAGRQAWTYSAAIMDRARPACRAAMAADPNLDASRALKDLAQHSPSQGGRAAMQAICLLRPPGALDVMIAGLDPALSEDGGAACLVAVAERDQPAARQAVDAYVQDCIRGDRMCKVLADAAGSSERVRARAAEVLLAYWTDHHQGFDQLRAVVCRPPVPGPASAVCRKAAQNQDWEWRQDPNAGTPG